MSGFISSFITILGIMLIMKYFQKQAQKPLEKDSEGNITLVVPIIYLLTYIFTGIFAIACLFAAVYLSDQTAILISCSILGLSFLAIAIYGLFVATASKFVLSEEGVKCFHRNGKEEYLSWEDIMLAKYNHLSSEIVIQGNQTKIRFPAFLKGGIAVVEYLEKKKGITKQMMGYPTF